MEKVIDYENMQILLSNNKIVEYANAKDFIISGILDLYYGTLDDCTLYAIYAILNYYGCDYDPTYGDDLDEDIDIQLVNPHYCDIFSRYTTDKIAIGLRNILIKVLMQKEILQYQDFLPRIELTKHGRDLLRFLREHFNFKWEKKVYCEYATD